MKKENLEKELQTVLKEAQEFQEKLELDLATVYFLGKESDKLMSKWNDATLLYDQKEEVSKQIIALQKRIEYEIKMREHDTSKILALDNKFNQLKMIAATNQTEN
jgi:hypothetical protein